jgi:hypothetical protein
VKSGTLYFPIGIHLGNNWMSRHVFSSSTGGIADTQQTNDALFFVTTGQSNFSVADTAASYSITLVCFLVFVAILHSGMVNRGSIVNRES